MWSASHVDENLTLSRRTTFGLGEGLPGRVWKDGQPVWVSDYVAAALPRSNVAATTGLRSAFAFPIVNSGDVIGVAEFFSRDAREPDADVLETLQVLGGQLGQFVGRIDLERRLAQSRELETVGSSRVESRTNSTAFSPRSSGTANCCWPICRRGICSATMRPRFERPRIARPI